MANDLSGSIKQNNESSRKSQSRSKSQLPPLNLDSGDKLFNKTQPAENYEQTSVVQKRAGVLAQVKQAPKSPGKVDLSLSSRSDLKSSKKAKDEIKENQFNPNDSKKVELPNIMAGWILTVEEDQVVDL